MARTRKANSRAETRTQSAEDFVRLVGRRIRQVRQERGMSQGEVAEVLGITTGAVSAYENGTNEISTGRLKEIADVFKVTVVSLISNSEETYMMHLAQLIMKHAKEHIVQVQDGEDIDTVQDPIVQVKHYQDIDTNQQGT